MKFILILILGIVSLSAQNRKSETASKVVEKTKLKEVKDNSTISSTNDISKWTIHLQPGVIPVSSVNSNTIYCYQGQLGIDVNLTKELIIGVFGQTMTYYQNLDASSIDNKIIEMTSIEYNSVGLTLGYIIPINKLYFLPQISASYDLFLAKAIDFNLDKTAFLDYRYISINPKLNIGYQATYNFSIGIYGGYNSQITATKGSKTLAFDPNAWNAGLMARIKIN